MLQVLNIYKFIDLMDDYLVLVDADLQTILPSICL